MRDLLLRILRRAFPVAIVLGIMGYLFAELFLILHQMNGGVQDPANNAVRWKAPLRMAGIGVILLAFIECLMFVFRRKQTPPAASIADPDLAADNSPNAPTGS